MSFILVLLFGMGLVSPPLLAQESEPDWKNTVQAPIAMDRTVEAGVPSGLTVPVVEALIEADVPLYTYSTFLRTVPRLMAEDRSVLEEYPDRIREVSFTDVETRLDRAWKLRDELVARGFPIDDRFPSIPAPLEPGYVSPDLRDAILGDDREQPDPNGEQPGPGPPPPGPGPGPNGPGPGPPGEPGL